MVLNSVTFKVVDLLATKVVEISRISMLKQAKF